MAGPVNVGGIRLDTRVLDKITAELRPKAAQIVVKYAFVIQGDAMKNAPVDTGALKNSMSVEMIGELTAKISDGVEYGIFQELGTHKMAAQPFLMPALEHWFPSFCRAFSGLFKP